MIPQSVLCREIVDIFATLPLSILVGKLLACQVCCSCSETKWWTWVQVTEFHGFTFMFERNHWIIFYCEKLMEVGTNRLHFKTPGVFGLKYGFSTCRISRVILMWKAAIRLNDLLGKKWIYLLISFRSREIVHWVSMSANVCLNVGRHLSGADFIMVFNSSQITNGQMGYFIFQVFRISLLNWLLSVKPCTESTLQNLILHDRKKQSSAIKIFSMWTANELFVKCIIRSAINSLKSLTQTVLPKKREPSWVDQL